MQLKKIRVNRADYVVRLAAFIGLSVFIAQMLEMNTIVSALFACSFICVAANYLIFLAVRKSLRLDDFLLLLIVLLSVVLSNWELNFDYYKPAIIVLSSTLCIDQCREIKCTQKTCKWIHVLLIMVCIFTNIMYYDNWWETNVLVNLGFSNPNEASMWLVFLIVLLWDSAHVLERKALKMLTKICAVSLIPVLYSTGSRNCLIAIFVFLVGKLILWLFSIEKFPKWVAACVSMAPAFIYVGYMYIFIPNYDRLATWFSFLISEGKPLTARVRVWSVQEMDRVKYILFGNYTVYHGENLHNSILTVFCGYGAFCTAIVLNKFYKTMKKMPNASIQLALGTIWLTGCFEATIFVGVAGMYMLVLLLPIFHQQFE